eukprot:gene14604-biopygen9616
MIHSIDAVALIPSPTHLSPIETRALPTQPPSLRSGGPGRHGHSTQPPRAARASHPPPPPSPAPFHPLEDKQKQVFASKVREFLTGGGWVPAPALSQRLHRFLNE